MDSPVTDLEQMDLPQWDDMDKDTKVSIVNISRRAGISAAALGTKLGCSRNAILGFVDRNKLQMAEPAMASRMAGARTKTKVRTTRGRKDTNLEHRLQHKFSEKSQQVSAEKQEQGLFDCVKDTAPHNQDALFVTMMDLKNHHCRWPIERDGKTYYCGHDNGEGKSSYCETHTKHATLQGGW
ncbi:GcrA family cell cycle regulator [Maritalea porphyrae]|uniref:GcrA family cell cycle regulator n=1 Tax=Maritalea porphyrae TaxID=880732 RepID=UPI0022AEB6FF|nr:GcrA family cell cycle regulator [Maritalea porphyrae]MCZ4274017.1 hypothetical protein [Maritalea porphyrae]